MNKNKTFLTNYFFSNLFILFILDIFFFMLLEKNFFHLLLCFYVLHISTSSSIRRLSVIAFFIYFESFLHYGQFGIQLMYIIPLTILGKKAKKNFYWTSLHPYILLTLALVTQSLFIDGYSLHSVASNTYTITKIIANIIVLLLFSLK